MLRLIKQKSARKLKRRSPLVLFLLLLLWCLASGWGLARITHAQPQVEKATSDAIATVDFVPQRYQLGQELYLENCASCHIVPPPAILPTETWQRLLQDTQHYGIKLKPLVDPPRLLVWNYLKAFSRSLNKEEEIPYRIGESRYFRALHPQVKLQRPIQLGSCVSCHPSANEYNFRRLSSEWEKG